MMSTQKVAVVTGGNKGIGYAIVKGLCEKYMGIVYLTSRNVQRGLRAVKSLNELGFNPEFHQLDVDDDNSVNKFRDYLKEKYGGIDLLINNAAIAFSKDATEPISYQAEHTIKTNYFGVVRVCDALFPILRNNAIVVNVSSSAGHLSRIPSSELKKKLGDPNLTVAGLNDLMNQFIASIKDGTAIEKGWSLKSYAVSKVGVTALTRIQQRELDKEVPNRNISVNAVHPGFVDTELNNHRGHLTVEEGARAPLYAALQGHDLKGQYIWCNNTIADWTASSPPTEC